MVDLGKLYSPKQVDVLKFAMNSDYFMLINSGAKRSGKTVINNDLFLYELKRIKALADQHGVPEPQYILSGATLGSLYRNVLIELGNKYNLEFHMDKYNRFPLFGVQVCCFGHSKINDLGRIRGMTAFGAYVNEGSMAHEEVFNEVKSRCSGEGARILVDTNPDHPEHWFKTNYIDRADGKVIRDFHFELDDNTFVSDRYRDNIKQSTPSGMFWDRDIKGLWVAGEGTVYSDFDQDKHYISLRDLDDMPIVDIFYGVDWGYEHPGAIVVMGETAYGDIVLLEEHSKQHEEIDYWVDIAKSMQKTYGPGIWYCDSARPEHVARFNKEGLRSVNADKSILSGIEEVASLIKLGKFKVVKKRVDRFKKEIYMYVWDPKKGLPVPEKDDVLDAVRYAVYTRNKLKNTLRRNYSGRGGRS